MVCKIYLAEVKCEAARLGRLSSTGHRQKSIAASSYHNNTSYTPCTDQRHAIRDRRTWTTDGDKWIEIVYGEEKKYCVLGRLEQPRQDKNLFKSPTNERNEPWKDLFHLYSLSPHSLSFNSQQGPPLSSLSGKPCQMWLKVPILAQFQTPGYTTPSSNAHIDVPPCKRSFT